MKHFRVLIFACLCSLPAAAQYKYGFTKQAWPSTPVPDKEARNNRQTLIDAMEKHGFRVNSSEWWHFDFIGWKKFEVLDIDFSEL